MPDAPSEWTNEKKPYDASISRAMPFHRVHSASYRIDSPKGKNPYKCGCRSMIKIDDQDDHYRYVAEAVNNEPFGIGYAAAAAREKLIALLPSWVPVEDETPKELEGTLTRSFHNYTDCPMLPWHVWYDWNFYVIPHTGSKYLLTREAAHNKAFDPAERTGGLSWSYFGSELAMEVEWDSAALTELSAAAPSGALFDRDWAWPVAGQHFWCLGRWIYDCGHTVELRTYEISDPTIGNLMVALANTRRWDYEAKLAPGKRSYRRLVPAIIGKLRDYRAAHPDPQETIATDDGLLALLDARLTADEEEKLLGYQRDGERLSLLGAMPLILPETGAADTEGAGAIVTLILNNLRARSAGKQYRTRSEIHPPKAIASARWEAVEFDEKAELIWPGFKRKLAARTQHLPAIQFFFYSNRDGGYFQYPDIGGGPYEFIVDLPPIPAGATPEWSLTAKPEDHQNTGVLRGPVLLKKCRYFGFSGASAEPVVKIEEPASLTSPPKQVRVTVTPPAGSKDYGMILSLAWHDPGRLPRPRKVYRCKVTFLHIVTGAYERSFDYPDWEIVVGVNGRWFSRGLGKVEMRHEGTFSSSSGIYDLKPKPDNGQYEIWLGEDDDLLVAAHGRKINKQGEAFRLSDADRRVRPDWKDIVLDPLAKDADARKADGEKFSKLLDDICGVLGLFGGKGKVEWFPENEGRDLFDAVTQSGSRITGPHGATDHIVRAGFNCPLGYIDPGERGNAIRKARDLKSGRYSLESYLAKESVDALDIHQSYGLYSDYTLVYDLEVDEHEV